MTWLKDLLGEPGRKVPPIGTFMKIPAARALGVAPVVRVPDHGYGDVQRVLDAGAAGLFFPHVSDRAECEQVIRQASHPPYGTRGAGGGMRAGNWGMAGRGSARYVK